MSEPQNTPADDIDDTTRLDEELIRAANADVPSDNVHVDTLARTIGPRQPGSEQEIEAAEYLATKLREIGLPAARLQALAPRYKTLTELLLAAAAIIAIVAAFAFPAPGIVLLVAALAATLASIMGYLKPGSLSPEIKTVNVLSIVPPADAEVRRLIVTAPLDSSSVGVLSARHYTHLYAWLHVVTPAALTTSILITIVILVDAGTSVRLLLSIPLLAVLATLALLIERERFSLISPGAISHASSVAALIDVAASTFASPARWLEVWFLGVGASSQRGGGMNDFLAKNSFDPDTTYFVHLQSTGGGRPTVPRSIGAGMRAAPATPLLTWVFDSIGPDTLDASGHSLQRLKIDSLAQVTHRAGYQSVVVAGIDEQGRVPFLDHPEDLPYQVNDAAIDETVNMVALAIDALDREVASRAMLARSTAAVQNQSSESSANEGLPSDHE
jgi:hypothetical protein